jgi:hypothetical protein
MKYKGYVKGDVVILKTKSIFSVVRADDSVFAHETQSYDGKDELN